MGGEIVRGGFVENGLAKWLLLGTCGMCLSRLDMTLRSFVVMFEQCRQYRPRSWMAHITLDAHTEHDGFVVTSVGYASIHVPERLR
jgi:hypothetical protein